VRTSRTDLTSEGSTPSEVEVFGDDLNALVDQIEADEFGRVLTGGFTVMLLLVSVLTFGAMLALSSVAGWTELIADLGVTVVSGIIVFGILTAGGSMLVFREFRRVSKRLETSRTLADAALSDAGSRIRRLEEDSRGP